MSKNKNIYVLKHPSIGEIPAPMKQRLGLSPNVQYDRKEQIMAGCGAYRVLAYRDGF